ncbi:MAG: DNA helicase-4 [Oleiphilaceae bacterium]|jgi:DNA helicase-4
MFQKGLMVEPAMSFNVGDKVTHVSRPEQGYGQIIAIYANDNCDVKFGDANFSGLKLSSFVCAKKIIEREQRKTMQLERQTMAINRLLDENFIGAQQKALFPNDEWHVDFTDVKKDWLKRYFGKSASKKLSGEQRLAIGNCDSTVLLRARAGSGKTTVIKHKVDFKIRHLGFDPSQIMVLAFNKTAADQVKRDLQQDFNHLTFNNARTFHSLAYRIVQPTQNLLFDIDSGSNAKQSQFVEGLLEKESNPKFYKDLYEFFRSELKQMENIGSLLTKEDYYTFRRNTAQDTLGGDAVKSIGEKWIADFLFEHDIRYLYERAWYRDKTGEQGNYHPDFSLAINSKMPDVVIEHWGIDEFDEEKSVPEHWNKTWREYRAEMNIKREYWRDWNEKKPNSPVTFLETSVRYTQIGRVAFEKHLKKLLSDIGVICTKLPEEVLIKKVVRRHIARFSSMCLQFVQRAKKQCLTPEDLDNKISYFDFSCEKEKVFCLIANRIYHRYTKELKEANLIDFDDLMALAVDRIERENGNVVIDPTAETALNLNTLKWLMVDEFQDFSPLFFNLIKALRSNNPTLRLFCVGDNWQAINGFAGSDLTYFNDFGRYFTATVLLDLQNNYRSQPNIVAQGNAFMAKTNGAPSIPKATLQSEPVRLIYANTVFIEQRPSVPLEDNPDRIFMTHHMSRGELVNCDISGKMARLFKACYSIMATYPLDSTKFMILNRNNYLGYTYGSMSKFKTKLKTCFSQNGQQGFRDFDAQVDCLTAHRSKGEEADVVIILNALNRKFPIIHSDNELYRLLGISIDEVYAEEERLFYVAITRAKQSLYIVTEVDRESEFLQRFDLIEERLPAALAPSLVASGSPTAPVIFDPNLPF